MIKNERGVTLITLAVVIIMMVILVAAGVNYGETSITQIRFQRFSYELQQIQGRVDSIHEKMKLQENPNYIFVDGQILGVDVTDNANAKNTLKKVLGINYAMETTEGGEGEDEIKKELYTEQNETLYRYVSKRNLTKQLDIKNPKFDVIINFKTREVISVEGQAYNDKTYYRLEDINK